MTSFTSTATLSGFTSTTNSTVVISEINPNTPDEIEFMNVGTADVNVGGWQVYIYDNVSGNGAPLPVFTIPAGTICAAGQVFRLQESGTALGTYPLFLYGSNIDWTNGTGSQTAVLLRNSSGVAVDFAVAGASTAAAVTSPQTIPSTQWQGASIIVPGSTTLSYSRIGNTDANSVADWSNTLTATMGTGNSTLVVPFNQQTIAITPTTSGAFTSGVWTGNVTVNSAATQMYLKAVNGAATANSNAFSVISTVTANAQTVNVPTNTATPITLTGQDSANPGATLTYAVVTNPVNGVLSGTGANRTYTPNTGFTGSDSFTFTAANGVVTSLPATVSMTVAAAQEISIEQPLSTILTDGVSTIDYGTIPTGSGTVRTFTVKNLGALPLTVSSITKDGTNSTDVTIGAISSSTISGGSSATFDVIFTPAASGARTAA
ncbi:MAG: lamin tail domain-containing protein, partial [Bacteroidota bacterium]